MKVGDALLGPADWLRAALAVLGGEDSVTLSPDVWQIDFGQFPLLKTYSYKGRWIHWPQLEDRYLSRRLKLQSWTIRFEKGSSRWIY